MGRTAKSAGEQQGLQRLWLTLGWIAAIALGFWMLRQIYPLVALLGAALVLTYILLAPVDWLEKGIAAVYAWLRSRPKFWQWQPRLHRALPWLISNSPTILMPARTLAVLVAFAFFALISTLALFNLLPALANQALTLSKTLPKDVARLELKVLGLGQEWLGVKRMRELMPQEIPKKALQGPVTEGDVDIIHQSLLADVLIRLRKVSASVVAWTVGNVASWAQSALAWVVGTLAFFVLVFYLLKDGASVYHKGLALLPGPWQRSTGRLLYDVHHVMLAFIKGQLMLGVLTGTYMFIVYTIFGLRYALLLGVFIALAEVLPVIGTWIGMAPAYAVALLSDDPLKALWIGLCAYPFQTIKDNMLAPKVVGDVLGLHPLAIMVSLLLGAKTAGLLGILVAVPVAGILNVLAGRLMPPKADTPPAKKKKPATKKAAANG